MSTRKTQPLTFLFADDGLVPNNPALPLVVYRGAIDLAGTANPDEAVKKVIAHNGWGEMWRNGIYEYLHYHSMIHEALGIARGRARVRFGGAKGEELEVGPGDFVILPAGTGHQCLSASPNLVVIGAYPKGGRYDLCRGSKAEHEKALKSIPEVPMPDSDPVYGKHGPLLTLWRG